MLLDITLGNFTSYFGFFAALNLGYATSKSFREALDNEILNIREQQKVNIEINLLHAETEVLIDNFKRKLHNKIEKFNRKMQDEYQALKKEKKEAAKFVRGFKPMFLITTLYCLTFLAIAGFQTVETPDRLINFYIYNVLHLLNYVVIGFNCLLFIRSYSNKFYKAGVRPFIVTILFFSVIGIAIALNYFSIAEPFSKHVNLKHCLTICTVVAISPYLLHFLRAFLHRRKFKPKEKRFIKQQQMGIAELNTYQKNLMEDFGKDLNG